MVWKNKHTMKKHERGPKRWSKPKEMKTCEDGGKKKSMANNVESKVKWETDS